MCGIPGKSSSNGQKSVMGFWKSLVATAALLLCFYVRTNGAVTKGFEQDVGLRTTHYTFSTNTLMNSIRSYTGVGYSGPPVSKVSATAKRLSERRQKPESRPAPVQ